MAASENLLSLWNLNPNTYKNLSRNIHKTSLQKPNASKYDLGSRTGLQTIQTTHLRKRWLELKDREHAARQCNRELLRQFDRAQDTLRDMIAATAAMKTLRMEYDLFLEESSTDQQQELGEKTRVYYKQCLKLDLKRKEAQVSKSTEADLPWSTMASDADDAARSESRQLSLELDFKPVRLPTKYGENGDSSTSRESRKVTNEKRKKKRNIPEKDKSSSQESLRTSPAAPNSKSNESWHKDSVSVSAKIGGHLAGSPLTIKNEIGKSPKSDSTSDSKNSQSEQEAPKSPFNNSPSSSESAGGEDDEDEETQEKSHEKDESDLDDNEAEDTSKEDEDGSEDNVEEEEETNERDSDDIIVSHPQNKPRVHFTTQEGFKDNDSQAGRSDENSSELGDDDVENLLAPQPQKMIRKDKCAKTGEKSKDNITANKAMCNIEIFQARPQLDEQSDSDEHFYD
ncbi:uncharacterized protein LOC144082199 [Stigmatopora argus]